MSASIIILPEVRKDGANGSQTFRVTLPRLDYRRLAKLANAWKVSDDEAAAELIRRALIRVHKAGFE